MFLFGQKNPNTNAGKINPTYKPDTSITSKKQLDDNASSFHADRSKVQIGAALNYASSALPETVIDNGFGFSFKLGYNLLNKLDAPLALYAGLGFDYLYFGGNRTNQTNNTEIVINSNAYGWYPYTDLELGKNWPITVFGTAFWGVRFFYTRQNINYYDLNGDRQKNSKNIDGDATNIYGLGGGLKFKLVESILMELRYQKNLGNISKIVDPNTILFDRNGNLLSYQNMDTDTDLNMFFLGIILKF